MAVAAIPGTPIDRGRLMGVPGIPKTCPPRFPGRAGDVDQVGTLEGRVAIQGVVALFALTSFTFPFEDIQAKVAVRGQDILLTTDIGDGDAPEVGSLWVDPATYLMHVPAEAAFTIGVGVQVTWAVFQGPHAG